ncbi:MAG: hypothetical protein PUK04_00185 [Bacteroidales bacterium]|nr:hypothetical protein [Bacteroidales bacterium]MDY4512394.1 hypothetical protein [Paludibacteraceae bacterium]MCI7429454.1 hypothetical protein [Bacteroidales bacterium]MDD6641678.1 hypothetical protein [Bacteroidales bacterium]MDD6782307.1 hypothetical protein [Bacteroidales bacterium]
MKKQNKTSGNRPVLKRTHRVAFMLNDEERRYLEAYVNRYKVDNVSKFLRDAVMRTVLHQLDEDRPTLFD